jgi:hypothetical protein
MDADAFSAEMVAMFKDFLEQEVDPIRAELAEIKAKLAQPVEKFDPSVIESQIEDAFKLFPNTKMIEEMISGAIAALPVLKDGEPGKDADPELIKQMVEEAVAAIPPAKDGNDGKDVDQDAVEAKIAEEVQKAIAAIEKPKDGHSPTVDEYGPLITEAVQKAVAALPVPKDGEPGKDGKDGIGLVGAFIDKSGELAITATDGTVHKVGIVVGKDGADGKPGEPGRDGLGFDDMEFIDRDDGFYLSASKDGAKKEKRLPIVCDRGVWQPDRVYKRGDGVSWGGQFTICQADETTEKPEGSKDWRLAVRKGRDAKGA